MQQIFLYIGRPSALIAVKADGIILDLVRRLMEPRKARNPQEGRLEDIFGLGTAFLVLSEPRTGAYGLSRIVTFLWAFEHFSFASDPCARRWIQRLSTIAARSQGSTQPSFVAARRQSRWHAQAFDGVIGTINRKLSFYFH
ncbi:hypothetical protein PGT21_005873 [Puccinia graminis f. sp. tritici]|uniref:Uncharacterized protein n=1 Tax=Puccinia graminis f. sp. tritici TaxID=56615 RepID=A0A5B0QZS8_PUCGR|nr:hypothetical protein PGT21_005873 [Puccinia graminis f. sp. tritici]